MNTPLPARQPLQAIGNRHLPAKLRHKSNSSSPTSSHVKQSSTAASSMLSSSPPRSSSRCSFAFTSSPGGEQAGELLSSVASSPPPATPDDSPRHLSIFKDVLALSSSAHSPQIEHVNLEASSQTITIMIGETVHIGRKLKKLEQRIREGAQENCDDSSAIKLVTIPKAAKHASRHHCSLTLHDSNQDGGLRLDIQVIGQNGMQLEGIKIPMGPRSVLLTKEEETVLLGFYTDFDVKVVCKGKSDTRRHVIAKTTTASMQQQAEEPLPPVPTSEATLGLDLEMDLEDEQDEEDAEDEAEVQTEIKAVFAPTSKAATSSRRSSISMSSSVASSPVSSAYKKRQTSSRSRESSHQPSVKRARFSSEVRSSPAPSPYAHQDDDGYPPEDSSESEDEEAAERRKEAKLQEAFTRVKTAIKTLSLDLVGILASGIVFQPRATLTTSECIQSLLESQPSLTEHGSAEAWRPSVLEALRSGPFGVIENEGLKDAAGKKLEPDWHYSPELDGDKERKSSLQPFVKSIRSTQRQKKQYFFKKPSDLKSRRW